MKLKVGIIAALMAAGVVGGSIAHAQSVTVCVEGQVVVAGETIVDQERTCQTISPEGLPTP